MDDGAPLDVIMAEHQRARDHGYVKGVQVLVVAKSEVGTITGFNFNRYTIPTGEQCAVLVETVDNKFAVKPEGLLLLKDGWVHDPFGRAPKYELDPGELEDPLDDEDDD